ncbi:flagellar filament capping protein FliD [Saccharibacillus sp. CPCC 101409]|uniref:flagellar filament capping protein FliD n=1 Tax=Saccharibacillus sp. CPCC 101409 TaxID=3058041 RepID=UPI002672DCFA|nr:flagellar filament capping protein FliD [Saccharibacillus sp. CPCC 101409]MDO3412074.1 flagellar filament capping protein FliD [Saccharibacillus sp. CPCC 101409]
MVSRINGFSGMDIDSLVKNLMTAKRAPLDKLNQNKQILQWQRESYREVNSTLYNLKANKLSVGGANSYRTSAALNTQVAVIKDSTGAVTDGTTTAVKAEATSSASGIPMKVSVKQLATATTVSLDKLGSGYGTTMSLGAIDTKQSGSSVGSSGTYNLTFNVANGKNDDGTDKIEQVQFKFKEGTTLASAISQINGNAKAGVKAAFDDVTGQLVLSSKTMGEQAVKIDTTDSSFLDLFSKSSGNDSMDDRIQAGTVKGQQAIFSINDGADIKLDSNSGTYNGVKLTFQSTTGTWTKDASNNLVSSDDKPLTIATQVDTTKALATIKSFMEDYNNLISSFNTKINEARYPSFQPLTTEQRSSMNETDIKAWDEKAKSGMLKNDPFIKSLLSDMRSTISAQMGGLGAMGITTGSYYENGKLYIDEDKFKAAVEANPQQVSDLFQGAAGSTDTSIFGKFSKAIDKAMGSIAERAGTSKFSGSLTDTFKTESVMGRQLKQFDSRISTLTTQLNDTETRYYKQFSAMESAMSKYQSQLSQLTGSSS